MNDQFTQSFLPFEVERKLIASGYKIVAGIDEVGRGCIAGPVVAAAVILDEAQTSVINKIKDSKKISPGNREKLFEIIQKEAIAVGIGMIHHDVIDQINILQATFEAMKMAIKNLNIEPDMCLVDGNQKIPITLRQICVVKGDDRVKSIGAASIIAKVVRDRYMKAISSKYPEYGFEKNKGYGTGDHVEVIKKMGYTEIHRRSFVLKCMSESIDNETEFEF